MGLWSPQPLPPLNPLNSLNSLNSASMNLSSVIDRPSHHSHFFPPVSSLTSAPLPKLPPLASQPPSLPPTLELSHQPPHQLQSPSHSSPYASNTYDHSATTRQPQFHPPSSFGLSASLPSPLSPTTASVPDHHNVQQHQQHQQRYHDSSTPLTSSNIHNKASSAAPIERVAPLSLPLPSAKTMYQDSHLFDRSPAPTVSPISVAHTNDPSFCISPLSTSQSQETAPLERHHLSNGIDDSLIARLRDFSSQRPALSTSMVTTCNAEPQIRDTSESLAMGYSDSISPMAPTQLRSHVTSLSNLPDRPHACRKCSATFRRRDNLMAHIRAQHKGERPFKCEVCGFRFIKKDHAMKHWKVVHLKERPFVCTRCNSRFGQRSDLNKHVRSVHLRIKPFECEHCGLRFSHRGNQIRHQAVVHEKKKPFSCKECSSSFAEKSNLLKHCQAVHKSGVVFSI